jgi:arylsulfatase A-like enzyme
MLFVVTSTHGEEWLQRGALGHGTSLYDTAINVPLVMTCPEMFPRAGQIRRRSDGVDLMPTIFSMLEVALPEGVQGVDRSVEPTVETRLLLDRAVFAETRPAGSLPTGILSMSEYGDSKFILNEEKPAGIDRQEVELYRRTGTADWEQTNRAGSFPRIMATRRENLERWKQMTREVRLPADTPPATPDPRLKDVLRSLGYLQGMGPGASAPVASTKKNPAKAAPSSSSAAKP